MADITLQQVFGITPTACGRYMRLGLRILLRVLKMILQGAIEWPSDPNEFGDFAAMIRAQHPLIDKGFCFVDGLNIPVAKSLDKDVQNAHYNGRTCSQYCSSVLVFAPNGCLRSV